MKFVDKFPEFFNRAVVLVNLGVVQGVIAVIAIVGKIIYGAAPRHPSVDLLIDVSHPDHVHPQVPEIAFAGFPEHSLEIAAVKGGGVEAFTAVVCDTAVVDIVGRIAVGETVGDYEIYIGVAPVKSRNVFRPKRLESKQEEQQEQTVFHHVGIFLQN